MLQLTLKKSYGWWRQLSTDAALPGSKEKKERLGVGFDFLGVGKKEGGFTGEGRGSDDAAYCRKESRRVRKRNQGPYCAGKAGSVREKGSSCSWENVLRWSPW